MLSRRFLPLLAATAILSFPALAQETLPLKRVAISTSGLALFEHEGTVDGNQVLNLPVRLDRVDDMLKSLVVFDEGGAFGGVSLPGREPLAQSFRDLPFTRDDLNSLVSLLNALQGAEVEVTGTVPMKGRLMNVTPETTEVEGGGVVIRNRVSVMGADGVKTALLERLDALKFSEPAVQKQINQALEAVYTNRIRDQRQLAVNLKGTGSRKVGLSYVQEAPLWKSAYRIVLPAEKDKAFLQGWAILENTTGQDWKDVSVTLLSGAPVTYRQSLYESYYLGRPELPVKVMDRVMPRVDAGTLGTVAEADGYAEEELMKKAEMRGRGAPAAANMMAMDMAAPMEMAESSMAYGIAGDVGAPPMPKSVAPMQMAGGAAVAVAEEASTQLVFTFPEAVNLAAGNSLMVPFVSQELEAERVWVYQPATHAAHPLAAVTLKNESDSGLPPGILTLYEQQGTHNNYVGDAELPLVPKGETRFISYALDSKTRIDRESQEDRALGLITIAKGMLNQKIVYRNTTSYTIKAPAEEDRTIVIEHERRTGWELVKPEGLTGEPEVTDQFYRLKIDVAKGETKNLKITLQRDDTEVIALNGISPYDIDTRLQVMGKDIKPEIRKVLEDIRNLSRAVYDIEAQLQNIAQQRQTIFQDQGRLRENLKTVSPNTDLGKRYLKQMDDQENNLDRMAKQESQLQSDAAAARKKLSDYVAGIDL